MFIWSSNQYHETFFLGLKNIEAVAQSWYRCFPVNFTKFLRTPFSQNTFGRLLLKIIEIGNKKSVEFWLFIIIFCDKRHLIQYELYVQDFIVYPYVLPYVKHLQTIDPSFVTITKPMRNDRRNILRRIEVNV